MLPTRLLSFALIFIGFVVVADAAPKREKKAEPKTVKIGLIASSTGPDSDCGDSFVRGVALAEETQRLTHGVKFVTSFYDDGGSPERGLNAFSKLLINEKVEALINMSRATIDAIYPSVVEKNLPVVQYASPSRSPTADSLFQIKPDTRITEEALGKSLKGQDIIVFYSLATKSRALENFKEGYGGDPLTIPLEGRKPDIRASVVQAFRNGPRGVVVLAEPEDGVVVVEEVFRLIKPLQRFYFDTTFQRGLGIYLERLGSVDPLSGGKAVIVTRDIAAKFSKHFVEKFHQSPDLCARYGYESFRALEYTYAPSRNDWVAKLRDTNLLGLDSSIRFDDRGLRVPVFKIVPIKQFLAGRTG